MQIIVKKSQPRIDPKRPASHPDYERAVDAGKRNLPSMKFESEGDRRDYERAVLANPNNVMGQPAFYPPMKIRTFVNVEESDAEKERRILESKIRSGQRRDIAVYCKPCNKVTEHSISIEQGFCKECGNQTRMRLAWA